MSTLNNSEWFYSRRCRPLRRSIRKNLKLIRTVLLMLLLSILLLTSGCQSVSSSSKQLQAQPVQERVVIDQSLMTEPNYTQRLLQVLSE